MKLVKHVIGKMRKNECKKYKLSRKDTVIDGVTLETLYRIIAIKSFGSVKKGDRGGYVRSYSNLSQEGDAWVFRGSCVTENARVSENAIVREYSRVGGNASVGGNAIVSNRSIVDDHSIVCGNAVVNDHSRVTKNARVDGNARVQFNAIVSWSARVDGNASVEFGVVRGNSIVDGNSIVCGNVDGYAHISGNAKILHDEDYIVFKNWWSSKRHFTWTRNDNMWKVGCFRGTGDELIQKAYKDSERSGREYERVVRYVESIIKDYEQFESKN